MDKQSSNPHIIGLTGSFGSGCTYITDSILVPSEYEKVSLSAILKDLYKKEHGKEPECRSDLQNFGDVLRQKEGSSYLSNIAIARIKDNNAGNKKWVIDSIRNPAEIQALRSYSRNFFLIGVYADKETRWTRVKDSTAGYNGDRNAFDHDDQNDTGKDSASYGQRVSDCFYESDIVLRNDLNFSAVGNANFNQFKNKVLMYVDLLQTPLNNKQATRDEEAMMAMAYAISQRSSCLQRKVGAVITDGSGGVISTGFNEVPPREKPCLEEHTTCYRGKRRQEFFSYLLKTVDGFEKYKIDVEKAFKEQFRVLDICRALHAEENAIINLARHGRSAIAKECTLYTTTYPCRLCANKISQLGISRVVYLEPYPDEEAKIILEGNGVTSEFFEGITFRAYFRVYGVAK